MRTSLAVRNIAKMLDYYSQFNPSPLSIKQFIDFGESRTYTIQPFSSRERQSLRQIGA